MTTEPHPEPAVPDHDVRRTAFVESIRDGLWVIPTSMILVASALAIFLIEVVGTSKGAPLSFQGDASSAQDLLATIAASTLSMTTLVVSITIVALQLASQQFSPRVMRTFFRDRGTKAALGVFLSTTVYALLVLRSVTPEEEGREAFVPVAAVSVAFGLVLASIMGFLYFLNHVAHAIRAVHIMEAVAAETRTAIRGQWDVGRRLAVDEWPTRPPDQIVPSEQPPGVVVGIDEDDLVLVAERAGAQLRLVPRIGDYLPSRAPMVEVWFDDPSSSHLTAADIVGRIGLGRERTMRHDVAFGFRQLVDIAEKALSPGINDPTTAVQALDRIHDLLRRLAERPEPCDALRDASGRARVLVDRYTWDDHVHLALDEVRHYGRDSIQIHRRLRALLDDLSVAVADRPERLAVLEEQRRLVDRAAVRAFEDPEDRRNAGFRGAAD